ncbi:MAG: hypothetical protein KGH58_03305 [Candidatus Micrarchaeota archaeon]|nr:hypothetical protein [Candidatus Micrarchaeota archaeon]
MYYREFARIKKIENFLENLAYASILLDAGLSVATLLVIKGVLSASASFVALADYLVFIEVILAGVMLAVILALKHYSKLTSGIDRLIFKAKYKAARV